jgi:hypothetical protein
MLGIGLSANMHEYTVQEVGRGLLIRRVHDKGGVKNHSRDGVTSSFM